MLLGGVTQPLHPQPNPMDPGGSVGMGDAGWIQPAREALLLQPASPKAFPRVFLAGAAEAGRAATLLGAGIWRNMSSRNMSSRGFVTVLDKH